MSPNCCAPKDALKSIDTESGSPLADGESPRNPHAIPQPGFMYRVKLSIELVKNHAQWDAHSKNYMLTWNLMIIAVGPCNQRRLGPYLNHRLFLQFFFGKLYSFKWVPQFKAQLTDLLDAGQLNADEYYDLCKRLRNVSYNPLQDPLCSLFRDIVQYASIAHEVWKRRLEQGGYKLEDVPVYAVLHPETLNKQQMYAMVLTVFYRTGCVAENDPRRNFMADPLDTLVKFTDQTKEVLTELFSAMGPITLCVDEPKKTEESE